MKFQYSARDDKGRHQEGVVQASSEEAALQTLDHHGLYITFLKEVKDKPAYAQNIGLFDHISTKDVMMFSRQLAIMFKARVSLVDALSTIGVQLKSKKFREVILQISEEVEGGTALSQALGKHPKAFSPFYVNIVMRGETLGKLSDVLDYLADHLEREHALKGKIKGAMMYPIFVMVVGAVVMTLMVLFVLPNLTSVLTASGNDLPLATDLVILFADFYREWWWAFGLAVVGVIVGIARLAKTKRGRSFLHRAVLKIPGLNSFLKMLYISRFGENLSTLISGGVPIVEALTITQKIVGNEVYEKIIGEAKDEISQGNRVGDVFERYPNEFPAIFTQMITVGEKSGALDTTLIDIVGFYQKEMDRSVDAFLSLIEPTMLVVLGVAVGVLMVSLMLPLYQNIAAV